MSTAQFQKRGSTAVSLAIRTCVPPVIACDLVVISVQYDDHQYIDALRLLQKDSRISSLGLCNFDTQRLEEILNAGINVASNQVQVGSRCSNFPSDNFSN
jgi:hypothetical protein